MANNADYKRVPFPTLDATSEEILAYRDRHFNMESFYRCRIMERASQNIHYVLGRQWIELDTSLIADGSRGYVFRDLPHDEANPIPRPVTNMIAPAVEAEVASLGKRELTAKVVPTSSDPRIESAARLANEILEDRLHQLNWPAVREELAYDFIVTGLAILKSYWDRSWSDYEVVGSEFSQACPQCNIKLATNKIPSELAPEVQFGSELLTPVDADSDLLEMQVCPKCGGSLQAYSPSLEEAYTESDVFQRPMGQTRPKGQTALEVVSMFDFFPENSGVGVTPDTCRVWGQCSVRSLDWIEERYPDFFPEVAPEDPTELLRWHPQFGEWSHLGRFDYSLDSSIYDNHSRVYELYQDRSWKNPLGRLLIVVGKDLIVENTTLYTEIQLEDGKTKVVPRVKFCAATFKRRRGEFWGHTFVEDLISPQNRLNGMDSQIVDARERMGSPHWLFPDGAEVSGPEWDEAYGSGKFLYWTPDPTNPTIAPQKFGDVLMNTGIYQERDRVVADMKTLAGPQDVELGEAPKNITTTSGLQLLNEAAERRRGPRERSLHQIFQQAWEHQLQLVWAFRDTPDTYEYSKDGITLSREYTNSDILGQCKVKVEKQGYVDRSLYQKEATREAQMDGLINANSVVAKQRILELRGLPTNINEEIDYQVLKAKQQWVRFAENGEVPQIDRTLDDPAVRFEVLKTQLLTDQGDKLAVAAGWPMAAPMLANWQMMIGLVPGMPIPPGIENTIFQVWVQMMGGVLPQIQPDMNADPMAQQQKQQAFFQFRAVFEAYGLLVQEQMMQQMMAEQSQQQSAPGDKPPTPPKPGTNQ